MTRRGKGPARRASAALRSGRGVLGALIVGLLAAMPVLTDAENGEGPPTPHVDRLLRHSPRPVILPRAPIEADLQLAADRTTHWKADRTHYLLLEDDVRLAIGSYRFRTRRAVVLISPIESLGITGWRLELYLDEVRRVGDAAVTAVAPRMLVTASIIGAVKLDTDRLAREAAAEHPLVVDALERVARYHRNVRQNTTALASIPSLHDEAALRRQAERREALRRPSVAVEPAEPAPPVEPPRDEQSQIPERIPEAEAVRRVHFRADQSVSREEDGERFILLDGNVRLMYYDPQLRRSLNLAADRVVIFTDAGQFGADQQLDADAVRGVYLEDHVVISDGEYTLRGPRIFYDLQRDRAIVLDAVFYTYDLERRIPIYVRAEKLLQVSQREWRAEEARLTTSAFAEPHIALGAERLTIREEPDGDDGVRRVVEAEDTTLRAGDLPIFYWPSIAGEATEPTLRDVDVNFSGDDGLVINTRWDLFRLAGRDAPRGVDASLLVDGYTERGPALGADLDYNVPKAFGRFDVYGMYDEGEDEPGGREEVEPADEWRGLLRWQHRHYLGDDWEVSIEAGLLSDETFLEEFFPERAYTDKPWETSIYAKHQTEDQAFTFLVDYDLIDSLPQLPRLQTPGYEVEKLPELGYYRIGTPLLDSRLTWFSENRLSALSLSFPEQSPRQLGFDAAEAVALFGISATRGFDDELDSEGLDEGTVLRADTRQELNLPLKLGPIDMVPYVAGRITAYDSAFDDFSPEEDDKLRVMSETGVKLHTSFSRTYGEVNSRLFDLHRLRHTIEPSAHVGYTWSSIEREALPVFDYEIESPVEGTFYRLGLRNTLETQRGGPGGWRSVEWLRIDTDFVFHSDDSRVDVDRPGLLDSPIARFIDHRPTYSTPGDHFWTEVAWQVSDTLAAVGNLVHSFDSDEIEQWNLGLTLDHTPRLRSYLSLRTIDEVDSSIIRYGVDYLLSRKYHVSVSHSYELEEGESRNVSLVLTRRLPQMLLMLGVDVDPVENDTSIGIALAAEGTGRGAPDANPFLRDE